jgi:hypothetical protein
VLIAFDHLVLVDLLISNETCFLEYLTTYTRRFGSVAAAECWMELVVACVAADGCTSTYSSEDEDEDEGDEGSEGSEDAGCEGEAGGGGEEKAGEEKSLDPKVTAPRLSESDQVVAGTVEFEGEGSEECEEEDGEIHTAATQRHNQSRTLTHLSEMLIRLRLTLERLTSGKLFPYNPAPLVRRLQAMEVLYDA